LPGAVCGAGEPIPARKRSAWVHSVVWPWWSIVSVSIGRPRREDGNYGDLEKGWVDDAAALYVSCSNGGGMAAGQLAFTAVIFVLRSHTLRPVGVITPQQPEYPAAGHVPILGSVEILSGKVIAEEVWYGLGDGTCCPTGRAATVWNYDKGTLTPERTVVIVPPNK
jgi:hypothetical protein